MEDGRLEASDTSATNNQAMHTFRSTRLCVDPHRQRLAVAVLSNDFKCLCSSRIERALEDFASRYVEHGYAYPPFDSNHAW